MECQTLPTTKCVLCLRPTEKLSSENKCWQQKITDLYVIYLKPKLATTTTASVNWASLLKGRSFYYSQFCSDCMTSGQKLMSMNDRLIALQCAIQDFIQNLSEEILKYRDELDPSCSHMPTGSVWLSPQQFSNYSAHEIEIKKEDDIIKNEVDTDKIYMEKDEYISNQTSVNSQDPLNDQVDSNDPSGDEDYLYYEELNQDQDSSDSTRETPGLLNQNELPLKKKKTHSKDMKDVLKNIQSRKLVVSLKRLEDESKGNTANRRKSGKNKSTSRYNTRKRKLNFKHIFEEYGYDFDIDGNEIRSVPEVKEEKKTEFELALDNAIEQQVNRDLSATKQVKENLDLECTICKEKFNNLADFETHLFMEHRRTPAQCKKCEQIFIDREALRGHMLSVHPNNTLTLCIACPGLVTFPNLYEYELHVMTHTEEIPYECHKCHKIFSTPRTYCEHQKSSSCANLGGEFVCEKCDEVFKFKCVLLTHMIVFHKGKKKKEHTLLNCNMCESLPMRKFSLEDHYAEHTEEFILPCDICGMSLQNLAKFDEHRKSHRANVAIPCNSCDKKFKNLTQLKSHIKIAHTEGIDVTEYICEHCGKKYVGKVERYRWHIKNCNKSFICDICGKHCTNSRTLRTHIEGHADGFPTCSVCNTQFSSNQGLKQHFARVHLREQTVVCEFCGKTLITKGSLVRHMKDMHSQNVECNICGEKFMNTYKMKKHKQDVHTKQIIHCQYCSEGFPTYDNLRRHEDLRHWEIRNKDFKCAACGEVFKQDLQRSKHRKKMHPELLTSKVNKECQLCKKVFSSRKGLIVHMRRHEGDKDGSFQCQICNKTFLTQIALTWHMNHDHKSV